MITEKIQKIKFLREQKELIMREELEQTRPVRTDLDMIPVFFEKFKEAANPKNKDNIKIFVYLMFFMYSPASCVGRGVRGGVRRNIAKLLQVSNCNVSVQFSDAKVLFNSHKGFQAEAERLYQHILSA